MDEIISAILRLVQLSNQAFRSGKAKMGSDYLNAALELSEQYDVNLNKLIQESLKRNLDNDPQNMGH